MASDAIGCSLAEAADSPAYTAYLQEAAGTPNSLHVVYVNTSLATKARAHSLVPTITATSSNVVATVLQAFVQVRCPVCVCTGWGGRGHCSASGIHPSMQVCAGCRGELQGVLAAVSGNSHDDALFLPPLVLTTPAGA
jgi:hypothetical protein